MTAATTFSELVRIFGEANVQEIERNNSTHYAITKPAELELVTTEDFKQIFCDILGLDESALEAAPADTQCTFLISKDKMENASVIVALEKVQNIFSFTPSIHTAETNCAFDVEDDTVIRPKLSSLEYLKALFATPNIHQREIKEKPYYIIPIEAFPQEITFENQPRKLGSSAIIASIRRLLLEPNDELTIDQQITAILQSGVALRIMDEKKGHVTGIGIDKATVDLLHTAGTLNNLSTHSIIQGIESSLTCPQRSR